MHVVEIDEVKRRLFEKFGNNIVLLEYVHMNENSKFLCKKHNLEFYTRPGQIIRRGTGCPSCANERRRDKHSFSYEHVKNFIENENCILLSEEYINCDSILKVIFACGHNGAITFWNFKEGHRCSYCGKKASGESKRLDIDLIKRKAQEKNIKILEFCEEYKGMKTIVKSECEHGHVEEHPIASILRTKYGCRECANIAIGVIMAGEKSRYWKGGIHNITGFLKSQIKSWKKKSLESCDYKCFICENKSELDIHHLYSFSSIIKDVFSELNLGYKQIVSEYSSQEIYALIDKTVQIHTRHPLGKVLCREHHKLFHVIYGQENNSPEQFEEFYFALKNINRN